MTIQQSATEQIDQAIRLWREGYIASAVTLAGAAEGAIPAPPHPDETLFEWLKAAGVATYNISEKRVVAHHLNSVRDWLKHGGINTLEVKPLEGGVMLMRALTKFYMVYGHDARTDAMRSLESEIQAEIRKITEPILGMLSQLTHAISGRSLDGSNPDQID